HYRTLLAEIVADPDRSVRNLPLLSKQERDRILTEWNDTAVNYPCEPGLVAQFEAQVAQHPEAMALMCHGQSMSYGTLDLRASHLALRLSELRVEPEVPVGVCLHRSLDLVVAILAILKAGGAYVPLD